MSFGQSTPRRMDLAAFRLDEIEPNRHGAFRHRESLQARIDRWFKRPAPEPQRDPRPDPDMYRWWSIAELMERGR